KTSSAATFKTNIEKKIDMKGFIMYESIAFLCGNFDDFRNNANNYYIYISSSDNITHFIPYDFDRGLGAGCEGRQNYMTTFSAESTKMQCSGNWQTCNLFWRTICTSTSSSSGHANVARVEEYRASYQNNIEKLLNEGKISSTSFTNYVNSFPDSYQGDATGAGYNNISFNEYLSRKIAAIKENNPSYNITVS
ncbi:MAG: CotH kinase family protein, partial [Bacilli bacterium]